MGNTVKHQAGTWLALFDTHSPLIHRPTLDSALDFLDRNKVRGVILGGDNLDAQSLSRHTKGKPLLRETGAYRSELDFFDTNVLKPIEKRLTTSAQRVFMTGNHENWIDQTIEEQPELQGVLEPRILLNLDKRGWTFIESGGIFQLGKLKVIHGDTLSGSGANVAKKALDAYSSSVLFGHFHSASSASKIAPYSEKDRHMAWVAPIAGSTNQKYLKGAPTAWNNGLVIVEVASDGSFNVYPALVTNGQFRYGGKTYGRKSATKKTAA